MEKISRKTYYYLLILYLGESMKLNIIIYLLLLFLLLLTPSYNTNSEEGKVVYLSNKDEEKLYKIKLYNFDIKDLNKIEDNLKIRKIILTGNNHYYYDVKSTDYDLGSVAAHSYIDFLIKNSKEEMIFNNNLYVDYIVVLNKYFEIEKVLKKYNHKIVS